MTLYSVTTTRGKHLVVDAGHISIVSELASKEAIREIQLKRKKRYTKEDYEHLESMMYDRLKVQLKAAQVGRELMWNSRQLTVMTLRSSSLVTISTRASKPSNHKSATICTFWSARILISRSRTRLCRPHTT